MTITCKEMKQLNKEFNGMQEEYKEEQDILVKKVLEIVCTYYPVMEEVSIIVAELDTLVAFAVASTRLSSRYAKPVLTDESKELLLE